MLIAQDIFICDLVVTYQLHQLHGQDNMVAQNKAKLLRDVLTEKQVECILKYSLGDSDWRLIGSEIKPACEGLAGFLGDHLRVVLHAKLGEVTQKVSLFAKAMPNTDKPKGNFIESNNYFKREMMMFKLFDELEGADCVKPWCAKALVYNEKIMVMPDLAVDGYKMFPQSETLDLPHAILATTSIARFHAAVANYEAKRNLNVSTPYSLAQEYSDVITEPTLKDSPWLRTAAKLSADFLNVFSEKYKETPDLEVKLTNLYIRACDSLTEYKDTLNVLIHKDLWVNNIMFRYDKHAPTPTNAVLIDFQLVRYAPPAFDLMSFLYLTTDRNFRNEHEHTILSHYFTVFSECLADSTKSKVKSVGYDSRSFVEWCEHSRMFGVVVAAVFLPYVLMEGGAAQETFDNPDTYLHHANVDRSRPVVAHAQHNLPYRQRQLEVIEEFVQRYVLDL